MKNKAIGIQLRSLVNIIMRQTEKSTVLNNAKDVTGTNLWIIAYLAENKYKDVYQRDLEKNFSTTRSTVSKVLKRMEEKGYLQRVPDSKDNRLKKLLLTEKAMKMDEEIHKEILAFESELLKDFDPQEVDQLHRYIQRMKNNICSSKGFCEECKNK
ncbi:MAG TPA: MarR family transcriptional regulator [Eubacteriaceae bacterium]|nr:MarR family transcriptional regulator [Eubacteriaceae bacterium]